MRPPKSALSQHYSQHYENTANNSISWNLHIFKYKMKNFKFFDENLGICGFSIVLAVLTVVLTEC